MYKRGFTLIELLVVISIIGVLGSIVFASLSDARLKARISNGENFRAQLSHALGDRVTGQWDLNECSGTAVADSSGYNNNGTFVGSPTWDSTDTPTGKGCSLTLSGTDYVSIPDKDQLSPGNGSITYAGWFKIPTISGTTYLIRKGTSSGNIEIYLYIATTGRISCRMNGSPAAAVTTTKTWTDGGWHYLTCVLDRNDSSLTLFVDGTQYATGSAAAIDAVNINYGSALTISSTANTNPMLSANLQLYSTALTAQAIQSIYAQEKARFFADTR